MAMGQQLQDTTNMTKTHHDALNDINSRLATKETTTKTENLDTGNENKDCTKAYFRGLTQVHTSLVSSFRDGAPPRFI